ncbi:hypothetical protein FRB90_011082 [Tulasnella sp. 427]|nr:hypothetical protein FRB90_011082 [Tulasnella sp. 427]
MKTAVAWPELAEVDSGRGDRSAEWDADRGRLTPAHAHEDAEFIVRDFNHWDENGPDTPTTTLGRTTMPFASRPRTHSRASPTSPPAAHASQLDADNPFFVRLMGRRALVSTYPAAAPPPSVPQVRQIDERMPLVRIFCQGVAAPPKQGTQTGTKEEQFSERPHLPPGRSTDEQRVIPVVLFSDSLHEVLPMYSSNTYKYFGWVHQDAPPGSVWESALTELWPKGAITSVPISFGLFMAGYFSGHAVIPPIVRDMQNPTHFEPIINWAFVRSPDGGLLRPLKLWVVRLIAPPTSSLVVLIVQFAATCIYGLIGAAGYRMFGHAVSPEGDASKSAKEARVKQALEDYAQLTTKLKTDPAFKALYVARRPLPVARIFASSLKKDVKILRDISKTESKEEKQRLRWTVTMAAKWAPCLQCAHDRRTNMATAIALVMYADVALDGLAKHLRVDAKVGEEDAMLVRGFWRRWVLSPLRKFEDVVEGKMSAGEWNKIAYSHAVALGKKSISGATLLPHELVYEALRNSAADDAKKDPVEAKLSETNMQIVSEEGKLINCLTVCDVSGSMGGLYVAKNPKARLKQTDHVSPIFPAVVLSLLLAQIPALPFANSFIMFSENPQIVALSSNAPFVVEVVQTMGRADWGMNTDFKTVFTKLILRAPTNDECK